MADLATLARPYANAAFGVAKSSAQLSEWSSSLGAMALASVEPALQTIISSPSIEDAQKAKAFVSMCEQNIAQTLERFVQLLAENKRLALLPNIFSRFEELKAQEERSLDVDVVSAYALSEEEQGALVKSLTNRFGREIRLESRVDASLLGGAIIRAGDTVIDGSVRGKMQKMTETLQRV